MSKNETFFVLFMFLLAGSITLHAQITIGLLVSVENNSKQILLHQNQRVVCEPFGIITLEKMGQNGVKPEECNAAINRHYKTYPSRKQFALRYLRLQQSYHFEKIKEGCVLYANGVESYSEMLLKSGLAVIDPAFDNSEWNGRLKRAFEGAEKMNIGLHETQIREACIKKEE